MVKLLYYRENADLKEAVERYTDIEVRQSYAGNGRGQKDHSG